MMNDESSGQVSMRMRTPIVDSIFVGRIGSNALTAISLGAPASSLMVELSFGVAVG